tara:strand:- start:1670 stop:5782 length:4113 start_codon:yes stop_codon:yes gene_type:complete
MLEAITEGATSLLKHKGLLASKLPVDSYALSAGLGTGAADIVRRLGGNRFYGGAGRRRLGKTLELLAAGATGGASGVTGALAAPAFTNISRSSAPTAARDLATLTSLGMGGEYLSRPLLEYATKASPGGTLATLKNLGMGAATGATGLVLKDKKELARQVSRALRAGKTGKDVPSRTMVEGLKRQLYTKAGIPQGLLTGLTGAGLVAGGSPILGSATLLSAPMMNTNVSKYMGDIAREFAKSKKNKAELAELYKKSSLNTSSLSAPVYVTMPYCLDAPTTEKVAIIGALGKKFVHMTGKTLGEQGKQVRTLAKNWQGVGSRQQAKDLTRGALDARAGAGATLNPEYLKNQEIINRQSSGGLGGWLKQQTVGRWQRGAAEARQTYTPKFTHSSDIVKSFGTDMGKTEGRQGILKSLGDKTTARAQAQVQRQAVPGAQGASHAGEASYDVLHPDFKPWLEGALKQEQRGARFLTAQDQRWLAHVRAQGVTGAYVPGRLGKVDMAKAYQSYGTRYKADVSALNTNLNPQQAEKRWNELRVKVRGNLSKAEQQELTALDQYTSALQPATGTTARVPKSFQPEWYSQGRQAAQQRADVDAGLARTQEAVRGATENLTRRGQGAGLRARNFEEGSGLESAGGAALGAYLGVNPIVAGALVAPRVARGARRLFDGNSIERLRGVLRGRWGQDAAHLETSILDPATISQLEHMQGAGGGAGRFRRGINETIKSLSDKVGLTRTSSKLRSEASKAIKDLPLDANSRQALIKSYEEGIAQHGRDFTPKLFEQLVSKNTGYTAGRDALKIPGFRDASNTLFADTNANLMTARGNLGESVSGYRNAMDNLVKGQLEARTQSTTTALKDTIGTLNTQFSKDKNTTASLGRINRVVNKLTREAGVKGNTTGDRLLQITNETLNANNVTPEMVRKLEENVTRVMKGEKNVLFETAGRRSYNPFKRYKSRREYIDLYQGVNAKALRDDALQPAINLEGYTKFKPKDVMNYEALTKPGVGTNVGAEAFSQAGGTAEGTLKALTDLGNQGPNQAKLVDKLLKNEISSAAQLSQRELQQLGAGIPEYTGSTAAHARTKNYVDSVIKGDRPIEAGLKSLRTQLGKITGTKPKDIEKTTEINKAIKHIEQFGLGPTKDGGGGANDLIKQYSDDVGKAYSKAKELARSKGTVDTKLIKVDMAKQRPALTTEQIAGMEKAEVSAYNAQRVEGIAAEISAANPSVANDASALANELIELGAIPHYDKAKVIKQLDKMTESEIQAAGGPGKAISSIIAGLAIAGGTVAGAKGGGGGLVKQTQEDVKKQLTTSTASWGLSPLAAPVMYHKKVAALMAPVKYPKPEELQVGASPTTSTAKATRKMVSLLSAPVQQGA